MHPQVSVHTQLWTHRPGTDRGMWDSMEKGRCFQQGAPCLVLWDGHVNGMKPCKSWKHLLFPCWVRLLVWVFYFLCMFYTFVILIMIFLFVSRGKVKAVSFLLPTDMSSFAEKQGSLKSPQNQSTKPLMTITEKDMWAGEFLKAHWFLRSIGLKWELSVRFLSCKTFWQDAHRASPSRGLGHWPGVQHGNGATTKQLGAQTLGWDHTKQRCLHTVLLCSVLKDPHLRTDGNRVLKLGWVCLSQKAETVSPLVLADSLDRKVSGANDKIRTTKEPGRFSL